MEGGGDRHRRWRAGYSAAAVEDQQCGLEGSDNGAAHEDAAVVEGCGGGRKRRARRRLAVPDPISVAARAAIAARARCPAAQAASPCECTSSQEASRPGLCCELLLRRAKLHRGLLLRCAGVLPLRAGKQRICSGAVCRARKNKERMTSGSLLS